jgi:diguanylate cyclase (GGDEF)-like protein
VRRTTSGFIPACRTQWQHGFVKGNKPFWFNWLACHLILLAACSSAVATTPQARLFNQVDGLGNISVTILAQQPDGHIWVGTQNGLYLYDGASFREFGPAEGLPEAWITSLFIDPHGRVVVGDLLGLFWFDGMRFHELLYRGKSLTSISHSMLTETPSGDLIVGTHDGFLSPLRDPHTQEWTTLAPREDRNGFNKMHLSGGDFTDQAGKFWFGCDQSVCADDGRNGLSVLEGVPADGYTIFFQQRDGQFWAEGYNHIVTWNKDDNKVRDLTAAFPTGEIIYPYHQIAEDIYGNVLVSTLSGFAAWDGSHWTETVRTTKGAMSWGSGLLSDREGTVWVGALGTGLLELNGYGRWANYGPKDGLADPLVFAVATDRAGRTWIGHRLGVDIHLPGSKRLIRFPLRSENDDVHVQQLVADPGGGMWIGIGINDVYHVDSADHIDRRFSIDGNIQIIRLDHRDVLWIVASNRLYSIDCSAKRERCVPQLFARPGLSKEILSGAITDLDLSFDAQSGLWLASDDGLDRIQNGSLTHVSIPGVPNRFKYIAIDSDQTIWLAGYSPGVLHIRVTNGVGSVIETQGRPALSSNFVEFLAADIHGRIWIGTDRGVNVVEEGKIVQISEDDGLIWNDTDEKAFAGDNDGSVWIGTSGGVSNLLDPSNVLNRSTFSASIEEVLYDGKPLVSGSSAPWRGGTIQTRFSGLTSRDNRSMIYHYQLEGFDSNTITTTVPIASFQKLPPGRYTMRVVAEDPAHRVMSAPAVWRFTLTPPWWRSRPFYAIAAVAFVGLIVGMWHLSNLALLAQRRNLEKLVKERTLELERLARTDGLTGLLNRKALMSALDVEAKYAGRRRTTICIALVDLDHFKLINDTLGHLAGDEVLREVGKRLLNGVRASDTVGRFGGEEFLIIFRDLEKDNGLERCELLRRSLSEKPVSFEDHAIVVTASIGLACGLGEPDLQDLLIAQADRAMYAAKSNGRNRVEYDVCT